MTTSIFLILLTTFQLCSACFTEFSKEIHPDDHYVDYYFRRRYVVNSTITCSDIYSIGDIFYEYEEHDYKQFLKITASNITTLQPNEFSRFSTIVKLYLSGIHIKEILKGAFGGLLKLEELYLDRNKLTVISADVFASLEKLKVLDLSFNKIHQIEKLAFENTSFLEKLLLQGNNLSKIDEATRNLERLAFLDLSGNPIKKLKLEDLPNLEYLYLNKTLFKEFGDVSNITRLQLLLLNITSNRIQNVDFYNFPKVDILDLSDNNIRLMENYQNMTARKLYLKNNHIKHIKTGFHNLQDLSLSHNELESLNQSLLNNSQSVHNVDLGFNKISMIEPNAFKNLRLLETLNLENNNISNIETGSFNHLKHLIFLSLAFNNIEEIKFGTFSNQHSLHFLDISHNKISKLHPSVFYLLSALKSLDFSYNKISSFDLIDLKSHLYLLRSISIHGNIWKCEQLSEMYKQLSQVGGSSTRRLIVEEGDSYDVENVRGIACRSDDLLKIVTSGFNNVSFEELQKIMNEGLENTDLQRFLNEDFNNSNFAKYFRGVNGQKLNFSSNDKTVGQETSSVKTESDNSGILIFSSILQVVMCFLLIFISYATLQFWREVNRKNENGKASQV